MEFDKVIVVSEDPESIASRYEGRDLILVYPRGRRPSSAYLIKGNVEILFSEHSYYPDIESLKIMRDLLYYLLNTGVVGGEDRILLVFEKEGERYEITMDMSKMRYPTLVEILGDRIPGELIEKVMRLAMNIVLRGREGHPSGALLIVGDVQNVKRYVIQKIANPIKSLDLRARSIMDESNHESLREFAIMDGATIIDSRGYVVTCGAYVKSLFVDGQNPQGFGGRHLAGQSISRLTRAISFVVSSEGVIRVYRDGEMVYEIESF